MNGRPRHYITSMIIDNLDIGRTGSASRPFETDAPLHIDPNAELACAIALQGFKTVASKRSQLFKARRSIKNFRRR